MTRPKQAMFLPEPKNYPEADTFQDLKVPKDQMRCFYKRCFC